MREFTCSGKQQQLGLRTLNDGIIVTEVYTDQFLASWQDIASICKPIIAAVSRPLLPFFLTSAAGSSAAGASSR